MGEVRFIWDECGGRSIVARLIGESVDDIEAARIDLRPNSGRCAINEPEAADLPRSMSESILREIDRNRFPKNLGPALPRQGSNSVSVL